MLVKLAWVTFFMLICSPFFLDEKGDKTTKKKVKKRKNIRKMLTEDELAEETRLEQEREKERIQWLKTLHMNSIAEEKARRVKQKSREDQPKTSHALDDDIILVEDSDTEAPKTNNV